MKEKKGKPFIIIFIAVALLIVASLVPWHDLTGGRVKDFNLFSDIYKTVTGKSTAEEPLDPELAKALAEPAVPARPAPGDSAATTPASAEMVKPVASSRIEGEMAIEDYTANGQGLANLHVALTAKDKRPARIAVIGDSYIEGDILTMNMREDLQNTHGGAGVGYMPLSSPLTGFRTSVNQTCKGWTVHDIRKHSKDHLKSLSGEYFTASTGARSTFKGTANLANLDKWSSTRFMFIAPTSGKIIIRTDNGEHQFDVTASDQVQCLEVKEPTATAEVSTGINGLQALGVYLDGEGGVAVDNMSLRGNSGVTHRKISKELAQQMRQHVDYDLIIVEYGINALSSAQSDYNGYRRLMEQTLARLKECYPKSDILLMGIGDRGQKVNGVVASVPTSQKMIDAQRDAARNAGVLFWDTREAMGGEGAVLSWRERGMINPDYIHLNAKGGKELADIFVQSLNKMLQ